MSNEELSLTEEDLRNLIKDALEEAKKKDASDKPHPRQYGAKQGTKRDRDLDRAKELAKSDDPEDRKRAYKLRADMEEKEREKPGFKSKPRDDSESAKEGIALLQDLISEVLNEALSAKTKETLRKKAEKRGLTPGSVEAEYKKGLAAWATSGSRKGMSQHQWAMARVNSANPSKSWAVVKKSKSKKKK